MERDQLMDALYETHMAEAYRALEVDQKMKQLDKIRDFMVKVLERANTSPIEETGKFLSDILGEMSDLHREIEPDFYYDGSDD